LLVLLLDGGDAWVRGAVVVAGEQVIILRAQTAPVGGEAGVDLCLDCEEAGVEDAKRERWSACGGKGEMYVQDLLLSRTA
jgi:hypothetical protein